MIDVEYYYSSTDKWFVDFAASLSEATGERVLVDGKRLAFPPSLAEGRYEFYELGDGIGVLLTDCIFHKEIRFNRHPVSGNEHYKILFNISDAPLIINKQSGRTVNISNSLVESVLFSSHTTKISISPGTEQPMRTVQLIFDRGWGVNHLFKHSVPVTVKTLQQFANYSPMQFITNIDTQSLALVEDMLSDEVPEYTPRHYLTGCACQLVALFFNHVIQESINDERVMSEDAMHVIQLREKIEQNLEEAIPTMEAAARSCMMSRTKFAHMFKMLYGNSYSSFFYELKLQKAAELLSAGNKISFVAEKIGYHYVNHFIKQYKDFFGYSPREYLQQNKGAK